MAKMKINQCPEQKSVLEYSEWASYVLSARLDAYSGESRHLFRPEIGRRFRCETRYSNYIRR